MSHTWPRGRNIVSRDELRDNIARLSRDPFGDILEALLQARPSTERLLMWAAEHPDRWANAIKVFATLNGYTERTEAITTNFHVAIGRMSDAEVMQCLYDIKQGANAEMTINKYIEAVPNSNAPDGTQDIEEPTPSTETRTKKGEPELPLFDAIQDLDQREADLHQDGERKD